MCTLSVGVCVCYFARAPCAVSFARNLNEKEEKEEQARHALGVELTPKLATSFTKEAAELKPQSRSVVKPPPPTFSSTS